MIPTLVAKYRRSVAQVTGVRAGEVITSGTGFLVAGGLVTNHHVLHATPELEAVSIRFEDSTDIRLDLSQLDRIVQDVEGGGDFIFLRIEEPEFESRERMAFAPNEAQPSVGDQVLFLGYPFQRPHLTAHVGHVSSIYPRETNPDVTILQLDASVNGGNSGGPLLELESGRIVGIVTRALSGLEQDFEELIQTLGRNVALLTAMDQAFGGGITFGDVRLLQVASATQAAMSRLAVNLRRSANVGIGFAFTTPAVRDAIAAHMASP